MKDKTEKKEVFEPLLDKKVNKENKLYLMCKTPFRNYVKGSLIKDEEEVQNIMSCHESAYVNKLLSIEG